jgi:hypothetical protein
MVRHLIETYWKDVHLRHGYELIYSPHIAKVRAAAVCCMRFGTALPGTAGCTEKPVAPYQHDSSS